MGSLTKSMIGKEDMSIQTNTSAAETFNRLTSTGSTIALTKIPDIWDGTGKIRVAEARTQHFASHYSSLLTAVSSVNSLTDKILYIDNGNWVVGTTDLSAYTSVILCFLPGATVSPTVGTTLTIHSPSNIQAAPNQQIFSGAGTISFVVRGDLPVGWFGDNTSATVIATALVASETMDGGIESPFGDYGIQGDADYVKCYFANPASASMQFFGIKSVVAVGTPRQSTHPTSTDKVAIYGEVQRKTGIDSVWGLNTVTEVDNLDGATIGYELDIDNYSGLDPGVNPVKSFWGLSILSGYNARCGTGIVINRSGSYSDNEWNRGIYVKEVKKIGIEIGNAYAGVADGAIIACQLVNGDDTVLLRRKTDAGSTGYYIRGVNAANDTNLFRIGLSGEYIRGNPTVITGAFNAEQPSNGLDCILLQRATDTLPTGQYIRCVNAANSINLFIVDMDSTAGETNVRISVAGAVAQRIYVGANSTAVAGYRHLMVADA